MKLHAVFFLLVTTTTSYSATWKPVSHANENGTRFYLDVDSIDYEERFIHAWILENRREKKKIKLDKKIFSYSSYLSLRVFDCDRKKVAIVQGTFYSQLFGKGKVLNSFNVQLDNNSFSSKKQNTMGEALLDFVCDKQTPHKIQT